MVVDAGYGSNIFLLILIIEYNINSLTTAFASVPVPLPISTNYSNPLEHLCPSNSHQLLKPIFYNYLHFFIMSHQFLYFKQSI